MLKYTKKHIWYDLWKHYNPNEEKRGGVKIGGRSSNFQLLFLFTLPLAELSLNDAVSYMCFDRTHSERKAIL